MKVSEILQHLTTQQAQEKNVLGVAIIVIENMIISNLEQNSKFSDLNLILKEFHQLLANWKGDEIYLKNLKASIDRAERYANQFTQDIIDVF